MNAVKNYLRLPGDYGDFLRGLCWSSCDDSLTYADGTTFAFNEEIAQFLEGFSNRGSVAHFGHILHLLELLRGNQDGAAQESVRLRLLFTSAGRSLRNAGAFFAAVCRDLPAPAEPVRAHEVCARLRNQALPIRSVDLSFHDTLDPPERPPFGPAEFERRVLSRTAAYREEELLAWFRNGRGPVKDAGEALARALPHRRTLDGVLATALQRPRLTGASGFVAQLVGALTLPPRRLERLELPVGGYSDVIAHGRLDQILPSQFALDEWDFLRRFAEQELLYFRREEPPRPTRHEVLALLDQGVRTWGDVRLVLGAAVLALGRQGARRGTPFFVAGTSNGGQVIDPLVEAADSLGRLLEASDLSANPGLALECVLETAGDCPRDIVLLTHPRSLAEEDVRAAARRLGPRDRLFAVALDARGAASLSELRRGVPVTLRAFQIDFTRSAPRPVAPAADDPGGASPAWTGDVEPVGYPFHFGVAGNIRPGHFAFDHGGQWLLAAADHGTLYAWKTDGSDKEILPRGMADGAVLTAVAGVVGVAGGFVVAGNFRSEAVAVHYDFAARVCTCHRLGPGGVLLPWAYLPEYHAVVSESFALDLATGRRHALHDTFDPSSRAAAAWQYCLSRSLPQKDYLDVRWRQGAREVLHTGASEQVMPACEVNVDNGSVTLCALPPWGTFTPKADGQPLLKGATPLAARCRGNTLALLTTGPGSPIVLRLFRGPEGVPLAALLTSPHAREFTLSSDGRWLARKVARGKLEVRTVAGDSPPWQTQVGGFSGCPKLVLGWRCLLIYSGRTHTHLLRWDRDRLEWKHGRDSGAALTTDLPWLLDQGKRGTAAEIPPFLAYDRARFVAGAANRVAVVADRFGQVVVFRQGQQVCMFIANREHLAGWMPDGTRFGPAWLTGGAASAGALEKFGRALLTASGPEGVP